LRFFFFATFQPAVARIISSFFSPIAATPVGEEEKDEDSKSVPSTPRGKKTPGKRRAAAPAARTKKSATPPPPDEDEKDDASTAGGDAGGRLPMPKKKGSPNPITEAVAFSPESAVDALSSLVGPHMGELKSAKWKEKLSGIGSVFEKVEAEGKGIDSKADAMMAFLSKYPGFGEKNFQVVNKAMEVAAMTAVNSPSFSGKHAFMAFPNILEKYTEKKCADTVDKTLMAFAQAIGPTALVNGLVIPQLETQKKPGALQGGVAFVGKAIEGLFVCLSSFFLNICRIWHHNG
jgi:cytoskeleton-associated protein 5